MDALSKYILSPIGGVYIFKTMCELLYNTLIPKKKELNDKRQFKSISNIITKDISPDFGGNLKENKDESKYIFIFNIDELSNDDDNSLLSVSKNKSNGNFKNISKIVDFIILNAEPEEEIILNMDSPGGSVIEYFYVYNQLKRLKDKGYKLNIFVKKMAASGGYLISCLGNITATNDSQIGSIGVYTSGFNYNELIKFLKIGYKLYKSGEHKNLGDPFDVPSEEADKKIQEDIINVHERFKKVVEENRKDIDINKVATAELWFGDEAKILGLVDNIGTVNDYLIEKSKEFIIYEINYQAHKSKTNMGWLEIISKFM